MKSTISDLITKGDAQSALGLIKKLLNQKLKEVTIQSARYNSLEEQFRLGNIDSETANISKNKIMLAILELVENVEQEFTDNPSYSQPNQKFNKDVISSININSLKEPIRIDIKASEMVSIPASKIISSDPISFNLNEDKGIEVIFKLRYLNRKDSIIIPKFLLIKDLIEALKLNYELDKVAIGNKSYDKSTWKIIINNIEYKGSYDLPVIKAIKEGDQIMIRCEFTKITVTNTMGCATITTIKGSMVNLN